MTYEEALKYHRQSYQAFVERLWDGDEDNNPYDEAFRMAFDAIEKQIPQNPTERIEVVPIRDENGAYIDADVHIVFHCPECGDWVANEESEGFTFCPECGQRIDRRTKEDA